MATAISLDGGKLIGFGHCPRGMPADAIPHPRFDLGLLGALICLRVVGLDTDR
jgi:hypothetical protein